VTPRRDGVAPLSGVAPGLSRRRLLAGGAALAGLAVAPAAGALPAAAGPAGPRASARAVAAQLQAELPHPAHPINGDETALPGWIACYSKGLPHNALGEVDPAAYRLLLRAVASRDPADFESIPLGGFVKLANPQAALAENLIGPDPDRIDLPSPPRFASAEQAAELVELYWQARLRDVAFEDYDAHPLARQATADLSRLPAYAGPRDATGQVTSCTLFRGAGTGSATGPYLSQFLYRDVFLPPVWVKQQERTVVAGIDYMTRPDVWLECQNGTLTGVNRFDPSPRFIRNGRDLGEWVHRDFTYQAALDACLVLLKIGAPTSGANPYKHSRTQSGFATFGAPYLFYLLAVVTQVALTSSWYQKWCVHRRLRPEEFAGRVEMVRTGRAAYPIDPAVLHSAGLDKTLRFHGTALLPQAYPEGAPTHPSYPAAHAVIAGAGVTVLKAFFDQSHLLPAPVVAAPDGLTLKPYIGSPLTVGGELDKLAWNVGMGRNFAGIHWRSDVAAGLDLGERAAVAVLREMKLTGNEIFAGFTLLQFDGRRVAI
jgi:membrane-associated phospholipid phosphatase